MITFPSLARRLKFSRINGDAFRHFEKTFDCFPIHELNLLIPNSSNPFTLNYENDLLSDKNIYLIVKDVTVSSLIQEAFLENFVNAGLLLGISYGARIEAENFISITPSGRLVLYLSESTAKTLSLLRVRPPDSKKKKRHFQTFVIDLTNPDIFPGKKRHQTLLFELSKLDAFKFNLLLKWEPQGNVCPQSLKSYFTSQGLQCVAYKPKHNYSYKKYVPVPKISFDVSDTDELETFLEWTSMQICGIEYCLNEDEYACKLTVPEDSETLKSLCSHNFTGLYSKADVLAVIKKTSLIFESDSSLPFIVVCVSGYQDSHVVSNGLYRFSSEDKQIYLVIFPSSKYLVITLNVDIN